MNSENIGKEIDRLWAKVGSMSVADPMPVERAVPDTAKDITTDAVAMIKSHHHRQAQEWAEMLDAKERSITLFKQRQAALESEIEALRGQFKEGKSRMLGEMLDAQTKLETGMRALEEERQTNEAEHQTLGDILQATRERLAAETGRHRNLERQWEGREQGLLLDLREFETLSARHQDEAAKAGEDVGRLSENLREAKNALEKTLSEFLVERRAREQTEAERAKAFKKVEEVERHFKELSLIWEDERSQWRELWDRERSTWETQRQEFAAWETSLRKEREAWHAELKANEDSQLKFVSKISESLRESSEASTRIAGVMRILRGVAPGLIPPEPRSRNKRLAAAAALAVALASAYPLWQHFTRLKLVPAGFELLAAKNPTSVAFDGERLWISEWDGRILSFDPAYTRNPVTEDAVPGMDPYHPAALSAGGAFLWSLDEAQGRIVKHEAGSPAKVLGSRATPGPAPTAMAYDGQAVWVYDAVSKTLFSAAGDRTDFTPHTIDPEIVPTAMLWKGEDFWLFDSKSGRLILYRLEDGRLRLKSRHPIEERVLGLSSWEDGLRVLAGPAMERPGYSLVRFEY